MTLHRSLVCALALFVAMPAQAGEIKRTHLVIHVHSGEGYPSFTVVGGSDLAAVTATVKSDAGSEDLTLVESDAWLHGAATIKALPETDATLTVTLYDKGSASLLSFSGTLGTDGAVTLTADATKETGDSSACALKTGCTDTTGDTSATSLDIEVLAGEVFGASGAYELGLDLVGADTYEVADATVTVDETVTSESSDPACSYDRKGALCVLSGVVRSTAEVDWDEIGAAWEGDLTLDHEGVIDAKVKSYDASGDVRENNKVALGVPWLDGGDGVNVLGVDEDPLTTVGLMRRGGTLKPKKDSVVYASTSGLLVVNSSGWTTTTAPATAELELDNGGTITIPVNSYQRVIRVERGKEAFAKGEFSAAYKAGSNITITGGSISFVGDSVSSMIDSPICASGGCFMLVENEDGDYDLSVSVYGTDAAKLPDDLELTVTITGESGDKVYSETGTVEFDDEVTAVFANEVSFSEDPIGLDLSGNLSLLGAADSKGKQKTLSKGTFFGAFSRDGDGDLGLAGADKNAGESRGDVVVAGDPIQFGIQTDDDGNAVYQPPPLTPVLGNGSGTKNAAHQASTKPELL